MSGQRRFEVLAGFVDYKVRNSHEANYAFVYK